MKNIKLLFGFVLILAVCQFYSCSEGKTPVDQYITLLHKSADNIKHIDNQADLMLEIDNLVTQEQKIIDKNSDYQLTDNDKKKIQDALDNLFTTFFDQSVKVYGINNDTFKEYAKAQTKMIVSAVKLEIEKITTLGEIPNITKNMNANL